MMNLLPHFSKIVVAYDDHDVPFMKYLFLFKDHECPGGIITAVDSEAENVSSKFHFLPYELAKCLYRVGLPIELGFFLIIGFGSLKRVTRVQMSSNYCARLQDPSKPVFCSIKTGYPFCKAIWDSFYCWPSTQAGRIVSRPCSVIFAPFDVGFRGSHSKENAEAYRICSEDGQWLWGNWTNYTQCLDLLPHDQVSAMLSPACSPQFGGVTYHSLDSAHDHPIDSHISLILSNLHRCGMAVQASDVRQDVLGHGQHQLDVRGRAAST
ncbi:unnamed protein product [Larinioides sclopetarius]|uniref:G-protein coupled receptors family 2 profile 1 domain-containing protein n=1 Tax=Larinioides sclopetarius TaxID=280406 RepID=A0AAV1ZAF1_9ARAC